MHPDEQKDFANRVQTTLNYIFDMYSESTINVLSLTHETSIVCNDEQVRPILRFLHSLSKSIGVTLETIVGPTEKNGYWYILTDNKKFLHLPF